MDYELALARLWNHANMPPPDLADIATEESFVLRLFNPKEFPR
jgi:hypothetical protein